MQPELPAMSLPGSSDTGFASLFPGFVKAWDSVLICFFSGRFEVSLTALDNFQGRLKLAATQRFFTFLKGC